MFKDYFYLKDFSLLMLSEKKIIKFLMDLFLTLKLKLSFFIKKFKKDIEKFHLHMKTFNF